MTHSIITIVKFVLSQRDGKCNCVAMQNVHIGPFPRFRRKTLFGISMTAGISLGRSMSKHTGGFRMRSICTIFMCCHYVNLRFTVNDETLCPSVPFGGKGLNLTLYISTDLKPLFSIMFLAFIHFTFLFLTEQEPR
ncbi:hypothetical protein F2P81_007936 [Scophthalmus maximus]|uniref:Uncharacterized protein n=1 Tax=Scophthalmus maximus TaxID=52904 RepID=A0A6A4T9N9_SCOMX|nr:hypothetical protein F2P81_007936 [Scophthalmus maximus]